MSAFGGKADIGTNLGGCPLLTQSRHGLTIASELKNLKAFVADQSNSLSQKRKFLSMGIGIFNVRTFVIR